MSELKRSDEELELVELARRVLPAGSFGNLPAELVIREGRGARVWDVSGNEYVDYLLVALCAFVITTLATLYPAAAASSLRPVEGIRYE